MNDKLFRTLGVLFLALIINASAGAQTEAVLPVEEMRADFDALHKILRESHPSLYRGISEAEAERNWRRTREQIKKPLTMRQFLNFLNPVVSRYNDGHTYLDLPIEAEFYKKYADGGGLFFPFRIAEANDRLFVVESLGADSLPKGTEIVAVNGKTSKEIFRDLVAAMSGDSAANRRATVARLFSLLYWQRFDPGSRFAVEIRRPNRSGTEIVQTAGIDKGRLESSMFGEKAVDAYELTPEIMVLEVNKMRANDEVKKFIDDTFARIKAKNYRALVVDIRRNGGGNSKVGDWVFNYLTRRSYRQSSVKEIRLSPYLIENNKFFRDWTTKLKETNKVEGDRLFLRSDSSEDGVTTDAAKWIYTGKVYLLTAPRTYSSGFMMAETFKCYGFGQLIGAAPGSYRNLTGELMQFRLPNSKIVGYVATSYYQPPCYERAKTDFLAPDVEIQPEINDLINGKDTVLEYIKGLKL